MIKFDKEAKTVINNYIKQLDHELGELKVNPVKSLVKEVGFKKLKDIEPKEIKNESLIKTKYVEQLMQFIDESQITKELCEDIDPHALEYRIQQATSKHQEVGK